MVAGPLFRRASIESNRVESLPACPLGGICTFLTGRGFSLGRWSGMPDIHTESRREGPSRGSGRQAGRRAGIQAFLAGSTGGNHFGTRSVYHSFFSFLLFLCVFFFRKIFVQSRRLTLSLSCVFAVIIIIIIITHWLN